MSLRPPKIYKHKTQKKRTSGPKNSVRKRQIFEHNTKFLINLRPQNYMNLRPQTKIVNPRLQKSCEPKANHAACSANASGGRRCALPPNPPPAVFFLGLPPLQGQPAPTWNVSTSNWNHRKNINSQNKKNNNSQNISAPFLNVSMYRFPKNCKRSGFQPTSLVPGSWHQTRMDWALCHSQGEMWRCRKLGFHLVNWKLGNSTPPKTNMESLKIDGIPKRKVHLPTSNHQVLLAVLLVSLMNHENDSFYKVGPYYL